MSVPTTVNVIPESSPALKRVIGLAVPESAVYAPPEVNAPPKESAALFQLLLQLINHQHLVL